MQAEKVATLHQRVVTELAPERAAPSRTTRDAARPLAEEMEHRLVRAIFTHWFSEMRDRLGEQRVRARYQLTEEGIASLVDELAAGVRREALEASLGETLVLVVSARLGMTQERERIAMLAADAINTFIDNLSVNPASRRRGKRTGVVDLALPEVAGRYWGDLDKAWNSAFLDMVAANAAMNVGGELVDVEQNDRLGMLIAPLRDGAVEPG
jgi:hypothetical protein